MEKKAKKLIKNLRNKIFGAGSVSIPSLGKSASCVSQYQSMQGMKAKAMELAQQAISESN